MRQNDFVPVKYALLALTGICLVFILISYFTDSAGSGLRGAVGTIVAPIQKGVSGIVSYVEDTAAAFEDKKALVKENEALRKQIAELEERVHVAEASNDEYARLQEFYALDATYAQYPKVAANVIGKDTGNWFESFLINKGTNDGILIGNNVIAAGGLVGRVVDVGTNWAKVRSIVDDASNVSAMVQDTGDYCVLSGSLELISEHQVEISQLYDSDDNVKVGEAVVTSNISDIYLPGIFIGYVSELKMNSNNVTKSGTVSVSADFEHLQEVFVITQNK